MAMFKKVCKHQIFHRAHIISGSMTVEAAMVFPVVLFVVCSLVYASLYLHDKVAIQSVMRQTMEVAQLAARYPVNNSLVQIDYENVNNRGIFFLLHANYDIENNLYSKRLMEQLEERLYITNVTNYQVEISYRKIIAKVDCNVDIPLQPVRLMLGESKMQYKVAVSQEVFRPAEFVRIFDVFSEFLSDTKVGDKAISKLQDILQGGE